MPKERGHGEGGLFWNEQRQRWMATASVGYTPAGKRMVKKASGRTKTEARAKLKEIIRDHEDGLAIAPTDYTVGDAVKDWLEYGLTSVSDATLTSNRIVSEKHIIPLLGARRLRDLSADDVDKWLVGRAEVLSSRSLEKIHSALNRSVRRAMARDKVKRNVVDLCSIPAGRAGRPSKALTLAQAENVLAAVEGTRMGAYVIVSLLTGARTEEMRALTWDHLDLAGQPGKSPPVPPYMAVWRSVRVGGDTKTRKSRRTLALPQRAVEALAAHCKDQAKDREASGDRWIELGLVFTTRYGTPLDAADERQNLKKAIQPNNKIYTKQWRPLELRHSFVSLLSDQGVPIEEISRLVGHKSTSVTELIYRKQIRPVIQTGAQAMDALFGPSHVTQFVAQKVEKA